MIHLRRGTFNKIDTNEQYNFFCLKSVKKTIILFIDFFDINAQVIHFNKALKEEHFKDIIQFPCHAD